MDGLASILLVDDNPKYLADALPMYGYNVTVATNGIDALKDNRGKRKSEDSLTEIEKLRAELRLEKAKRQRAEMELSFLKKLDEIERRRG